MYQSMSPSEIVTFVTVEDYQYYWKKVKERTSSSYSRLNFGHYIAAADSDSLSRLHAEKYLKLQGEEFYWRDGDME